MVVKFTVGACSGVIKATSSLIDIPFLGRYPFPPIGMLC